MSSSKNLRSPEMYNIREQKKSISALTRYDIITQQWAVLKIGDRGEFFQPQSHRITRSPILIDKIGLIG